MNYKSIGGSGGNFNFVKCESIDADISGISEDSKYRITLKQINSFSGIFVFTFVIDGQEFTTTASISTEGSSQFIYNTKNIQIFFSAGNLIYPDVDYEKKSITFEVETDFYTTKGDMISLLTSDTAEVYVERLYF